MYTCLYTSRAKKGDTWMEMMHSALTCSLAAAALCNVSMSKQSLDLPACCCHRRSSPLTIKNMHIRTSVGMEKMEVPLFYAVFWAINAVFKIFSVFFSIVFILFPDFDSC